MPMRRSTGWELGVPRIRQKINNGLPVIAAGIQEKTPVVNVAELARQRESLLKEHPGIDGRWTVGERRADALYPPGCGCACVVWSDAPTGGMHRCGGGAVGGFGG